MKIVLAVSKLLPADSKAFRFLADKGVNVFLGGASVFCFGVFLYNAANYAEQFAFRAPIGAVSGGTLDQRRHGAASFAKANQGDSVFFRDMIWVGSGEQVDIDFSDWTQLRLLENTFVVLMKQPGVANAVPIVKLLKGNLEIKKVAPGSVVQVQTVEGRVNVRDQTVKTIAAKTIPSKPTSESEQPLAKQEAPQVKGIYPVNNSLLYIVKAEEAAITLAWPEAVSGSLILTEKGGQEILRKELSAANSAPVRLKVGKSYEWRVHPVIGPVTFEIKRFTPEALAQQLDPTSDRVIEIIGNE